MGGLGRSGLARLSQFQGLATPWAGPGKRLPNCLFSGFSGDWPGCMATGMESWHIECICLLHWLHQQIGTQRIALGIGVLAL